MRYELTDYEWDAVKPMLQTKPRGALRNRMRRWGWTRRRAALRPPRSARCPSSASVDRMSEAISGASFADGRPACRFAHAGSALRFGAMSYTRRRTGGDRGRDEISKRRKPAMRVVAVGIHLPRRDQSLDAFRNDHGHPVGRTIHDIRRTLQGEGVRNGSPGEIGLHPRWKSRIRKACRRLLATG